MANVERKEKDINWRSWERYEGEGIACYRGWNKEKVKRSAVGISSASAWRMMGRRSRTLARERGKGAKMKISIVREEDGTRIR